MMKGNAESLIFPNGNLDDRFTLLDGVEMIAPAYAIIS
jgi:hypothetical protein